MYTKPLKDSTITFKVDYTLTLVSRSLEEGTCVLVEIHFKYVYDFFGNRIIGKLK